MTASKGNLGGGASKTTKVVSSTLAGVLAVGMIPAAGFAAEAADEGTTDADIDLLAMDEQAQLTAYGKVSKATNGVNEAVTVSDNTVSFPVGSASIGLNVTEITMGDLDPIVANQQVTMATAFYEEEACTTEVSDPKTAAAGTIYAKVTITGGIYDGCYLVVKVNLVAASLADATIYEVNPDNAADLSDTSFGFTGSALNLGVALNGKAITVDTTGTTPGSDDGVEMKYCKAGEDASTATAGAPTAAGDWIIILNGYGTYANDKVEKAITIAPLDLATANVVLTNQAITAAPTLTNVSKINDITVAGTLADYLKLTFVSAADGSLTFGNNTTYTYAVQPDADALEGDDLEGSIINSKNVTFDKVGTVLEAAKFTYNGAALADITTNLGAATKNVFDPSLVAVSDGTNPLKSNQYTITATDEKGNAAPANWMTTPGKWTVTIAVNPATTEYKFGGSATIAVTVSNGDLDPAKNLAFSYDNNAAEGTVTATYDGTNLFDKVGITVTDAQNNVLTEGTDYQVKIVVGASAAAGEEVSEIVNANKAGESYFVVVTSDSYAGLTSDNTLQITVNAIDVSKVRIANDAFRTEEAGTYNVFIPYTGSAITPVLEYTTDASITEKSKWVALPTDVYTSALTYSATSGGTFKAAEAIQEVGFYKLAVSLAEDVTNYAITANTDVQIYNGDPTIADAAYESTIQVSDEKIYLDVASSDWFASYVYAATQLDYMKGYNGSDFFGPYDKMKRGDVALVLYRMSLNPSERAATFDDDYFNDNAGYDTPFADVDSHMYYARAIAWASNTGIVTGYAGTDNFGPEDSVTREQFATMLGRFAQKAGNFEVEDADAALASYADGAQVDAWAKEYVAWAVENKIMGNNPTLNPLDDIIRAEIAKMVVVYQPEDNTFIQ